MIISLDCNKWFSYQIEKNKALSKIMGEKKEQVPAIEAFPPSNEPYFGFINTHKKPTVIEHYSFSCYIFLKIYT